MQLTALHFITFGSLAVFILIGLASTFKKKNTPEDYLLASRETHPVLIGLSSSVSMANGALFTGVAGFFFTFGISQIWLAIGAVLGGVITYGVFVKPLLQTSKKTKSLTVTGTLLSPLKINHPTTRLFIGTLLIIFMMIYAMAQFKAAGKIFGLYLDVPPYIPIIIFAIIVFLYCLAGGLRASIWTDAAQAIVMLLSIFILLGFCIYKIGDIGTAFAQFSQTPADFQSFKYHSNWLSTLFAALGWLSLSFGIVGQPHVAVRFIALKRQKDIALAKWITIFCFFAFFGLVFCIGIMARLIMQNYVGDAEVILFQLSQNILPLFLSGIFLAGFAAAFISTADSIVLSCSATLARDIFPKLGRSYLGLKLSTIFIITLTLILTLVAPDNIFQLALIAFSGLAVICTPLMLVHILKFRTNTTITYISIICGVAISVTWRLLNLHVHTYELLPALSGSMAIYYIGHLFLLKLPSKK